MAKQTSEKIDERRINFIYTSLRKTIEKKYPFMTQKELVLIPVLVPASPDNHFILITAVKVSEQDNFSSWVFVTFDSLKNSELYKKPLDDITKLYER